MRYYEFIINSTIENIEKNSKIRLKDYDYDSPIGAVNKYIYRNIISNIQFFLYREEGKFLRGVFAFNETKLSFKDAMNAIEQVFDEIGVAPMSDESLEEITTYQYIDSLIEGKRRGYNTHYNYLNETNEFLYESIVHADPKTSYGFSLEERVISSGAVGKNAMYDQTMEDEIKNIMNHKVKSKFDGNMVHYVISSKSMDATLDMADTLLKKLTKANRLRSRRIEIIRDIDRLMYKRDNLERVLGGNYGGAILIDMTEKFGQDPVDYQWNCKYIESLVKKYKNDCLFIFAYNIDNPGFAYTLLPKVQKHVSMVKLKEAVGSKDEAILYLQDLIKASKYKKYANQAGEFMENFRGNKFSQTEVLEAYEKFEPWCMNRNVFQAYNYAEPEEFWLDREDDQGCASDKLENMIGLGEVKDQIHKILVTNLVEKERKLRNDNAYKSNSMHMIFSGNPGTAKTTVANLFAKIAKDHGLLKSGIFVERGGTDYGAMFSSWKLKRDFEAAKGGVLFIDEAYAMSSPTVISLLIKEMENHRDEVIVVFAGYNERMQAFLDLNEGLKSRIPHWVNFPDYSTEELLGILKLMVDERGFTLSEDVMKAATVIFDKARLLDNFGNGRYVRNLVEKAIENQSVRVMNKYESPQDVPEEELFLLTTEDFPASLESVEMQKTEGEAKQELADMIGISDAKKIIQKAIATFKMKKRYVDLGVCKDKPSMHMVFTGNPGTAKTTTARLVAEILYDEKVLPSGKYVEVGRADLIGQHVGETAPLVKKRFKEARGGVLFIDEAYSLCDGYSNSYGDEAISTIVQEMENHREDVIVIFAGYPKEMNEFLEKNPGMKSRIAFHVDFKDYSTDELCDIAKLMLKKKGMNITDEAMDKLRTSCEIARKNSDFGNGRYVRRILEDAEMNLAARLTDCADDELDVDVITTIEACDIEDLAEDKDTNSQIGFRAS